MKFQKIVWVPYLAHLSNLFPLLHSGILLGTLTAVALNWYFNGLQSGERARADVAAAAHGAEA